MLSIAPAARLSIALLALLAATAQAGGEVALTPAQRQSLGIEVQPLQAASQGSAASLPATVVVPFEQMRVVAAPVAGLLEQVNVAAGDTVKAGQVLARMASPQLLELQRDHAVARSQADLAARNLKRDEALFAEGIIAESRLSSTRASAKEAAAMEQQRAGALAIAGGGGALVAPIGGTVLEQNALPGQRVEASVPLFRIGKLSPLWLEIQVPASLADVLKPGLAVAVKDSPASGKIINVGHQLGGGQTLTLRARIDKGAESLRPGQSVEAVVATQAAQATQANAKETLWRVPTGAVVRLPEPHIFVESNKGGFLAMPVKVASEGGGDTLVGGDLKTGYRVAVKGVAALKAALPAKE